jgi:translation elongation factor EF-G
MFNVHSPPIVSFRETIVNGNDKKLQKIVSVQTPNKKATFKIKSTSLPFEIATFIDQHQERFRNILTNNLEIDVEFSSSFDILEELKVKFEQQGEEWKSEWKNLWCLGPKLTGPNVRE